MNFIMANIFALAEQFEIHFCSFNMANRFDIIDRLHHIDLKKWSHSTVTVKHVTAKYMYI